MILVCLVVVLLVATAFTFVSSASAQLGNTGVPVRCSVANAMPLGAYSFNCTAADGTTFANGTTVPSGHYLMVTDVLMGPAGNATTGDWYIYLNQMSGPSTIDSFYLETQTRRPIAEHFTVPYLVLSQGQHLGLSAGAINTGQVSAWVSGLLTTNVTFAPFIAR